MRFKDLSAFLYLKEGKIYTGKNTEKSYTKKDIFSLVRALNNSGIDHLYVIDEAAELQEHRSNLKLLKDVCYSAEMPVTAGGFMEKIEDVRDYLYVRCASVMIDADTENALQLMKDIQARFGKEKLYLFLSDLDMLFKHRELVEQSVKGLVLKDESMLLSVSDMTALPVELVFQNFDFEEIKEKLKKETVSGVGFEYQTIIDKDLMQVKNELISNRIKVNRFEPLLKWENLKLNSDGMVPVVVQDYKNNDVLMVAYMNEEAFYHTLTSGKMTYWSRSRDELWVKGDTSGHYQYVKSLTADCDHDTILAKVSQIGAACHTGNRSCFFYDIIKKDVSVKNPKTALEDVYKVIEDRKEHPKDGSYSNYLMSSGEDKLLEKIGKEMARIVISSKNEDKDAVRYELSDLLYYMMVLMVEKGITWDELLTELAFRE
jgi:phosphoribosyl-AMP cyclohydrolase / phosphoribosyl-ATP pyrophosphohydrolase